MADVSKLAPLFAKLAEAAQEISIVFAGANGTLGKRGASEPAFDADGKPVKRKKEKRAPRAPTAFNMFMKAAVAQAKLDNPDLNPKEIFAQCASKWKDAPENPKAGLHQQQQPLGTLAAGGEDDDASKKHPPKNKDDKNAKKLKK